MFKKTVLLIILLIALSSVSFAQDTFGGKVYFAEGTSTIGQITSFPGPVYDIRAMLYVSTTAAATVWGQIENGPGEEKCRVVATAGGPVGGSYVARDFDNVQLEFGYVILEIEANNYAAVRGCTFYKVGEQALDEGDD